SNSPEVWHHTHEILTSSGERRLIHWNNSVLRSPSGEVIGAASIGEDITSRMMSERELRSGEEHLRIIVEASSDAIWEFNVKSGEGYWSDRAYAILGRTREMLEPTYANYRALLHPDDVNAFQLALKAHLERNEPYHLRLRLRHHDGSYVSVFTRGQMQRETGMMVGVFSDLSILEHAEEQIREQAALIDQAHDAIVVRDLDDRITFWSKGAERLYGWTGTSALGHRFDALLRVEAAAFETARKAVERDGIWSGEVQKCTATGGAVAIESSWTLLRDEDGAARGIFSIDTDITARKSLERQFFRAQRLESLGTLAGGIAHDLNNLLMPVLMGVTLLRRLEPDERSLKAIDIIERSVKRGTDLVKRVLLFASGTERAQAAVDLRTVVAEVEAIAVSTFPKNIAFTTSLSESPSFVLGDQTELTQVLLNLCVNARDAMAGGGLIMISVTSRDLDLQSAVSRGGTCAGTYVVLTVADNGTGISAEVVDRIYDPFFTTKHVGEGTGLGLSTVQAVLRTHGGFIEVSTEIGRGSSFCVYLPAHTEVPVHVPELGEVSLPRGNGETILVVDDEAAIVSMSKQTLEAFGYIALTAANGEEAMATYLRERGRIALVLTDMMMPGIDGATLI
ncbi:MAG: PAS domain S-box protein, partial [Acidobacteriota bacterium]